MKQDKERLIESVLNSKTLAIIGLEKNTGKTETLNFIVENVKDKKRIAITSIGTDGEEKDIVFGTLKPSVYVDEDIIYTTTETFFKQKRVLSEIFHVSKFTTPTGRVIIAKALEKGKIILSGPQTTAWMEEIVDFLHRYVDLVVVDGAISRFSQANPSIADSIVLATGAAYSLEKREIIKHTRYVHTLCNLPKVDNKTFDELKNAQNICLLTKDGWYESDISSALHIQKLRELTNFEAIYIPGSLTDNILEHIYNKDIIVRDFTKVFVSYEMYVKYKPKIKVLLPTNVIGITVNPFSPNGYILDSETLVNSLKESIPDVPIIDVRK
ncbi:MAG: hypothetical protein ACP5KD_02155 [Fervidobacterium sp.]